MRFETPTKSRLKHFDDSLPVGILKLVAAISNYGKPRHSFPISPAAFVSSALVTKSSFVLVNILQLRPPLSICVARLANDSKGLISCTTPGCTLDKPMPFCLDDSASRGTAAGRCVLLAFAHFDAADNERSDITSSVPFSFSRQGTHRTKHAARR